MNKELIEETILESKRFTEKACLALGRILAEEKSGYNWRSPEVATMKRASLDLTRQLARLRRG